MKKNIKNIAGVMSLSVMLLIAGCANNQAESSATEGGDYYKRAIISLPNGEIIDIPYDNYMLWSDGFIEIRIKETSYKTHVENVILINSKRGE